jgi:hypothetical protein
MGTLGAAPSLTACAAKEQVAGCAQRAWLRGCVHALGHASGSAPLPRVAAALGQVSRSMVRRAGGVAHAACTMPLRAR